MVAFKGSKQRQEQVAELRAAALDFLQPALGGDRLAAEYILLQLVSRRVLGIERDDANALEKQSRMSPQNGFHLHFIDFCKLAW